MKKSLYQRPVTEMVTIEEQGCLAQSPTANQLPDLNFQDPVIW